MNWRIVHGFYPDAVKRNGRWMLPAGIADEVVEEWRRLNDGLRTGRLLPLADAAEECGLSRRSFNSRATELGAMRIAGKWYVTKATLRRLKSFYFDLVTTTEAARILGFRHRSYVHVLVRRGELEAVKIGRETRLSKAVLRERQERKSNASRVQG